VQYTDNILTSIIKKMEPKDQIIQVPTIKADFTLGFCFQTYAKDFYDAYKSYRTKKKLSPARYSLICMAIESAAKALHAEQGMDWEDIKKQFGHNIKQACNRKILNTYDIDLDTEEVEALKQANKIYSKKGFEYFVYHNTEEIELANGKNISISNKLDRLKDMLSGSFETPELEKLESLLEKLLSINIDVKVS